LERGKGSIRSRTLRVEKGQKITLEVQARYDNEKVLQPLSRAANSKEIAKAAVLGVGTALSVQDIVVGGETKGKSLNFNVLGIVPFVKNLFKKPAKYDVAVPYQPEKPTSYVEIAVYKDSLLSEQLYSKRLSITENAEFSWENLQDSLVFDTDGFVVVSLRNESEKEVLFDELNVRVYGTEKAVIIQENHYEPFGMTLKGLDYVVNEKQKNQFLYNDGTEREESMGLEWDETPFRPYDKNLGRFTGVDLLAVLFSDISPFVYAYNNPVNYNDPTGLSGDVGGKIEVEELEISRKSTGLNMQIKKPSIKINRGSIKYSSEIANNKDAMQVISKLRDNPTFEKLYNSLDNSNETFTVKSIESYPSYAKIKENSLELSFGGVFSSETRTIYLRTSNDKKTTVGAAEEFFHAYQYNFYGKSNYINRKSTTLLEMEARLFRFCLGMQIAPLSIYKYVNTFVPFSEIAADDLPISQLTKNRETISNYMSNPEQYKTIFMEMYFKLQSSIKVISQYGHLKVPTKRMFNKSPIGAWQSLFH
jgi:RHS repeat-associated protein